MKEDVSDKVEKKSAIESLGDKLSNIQNIITFIVVLSAAVVNYMILNYRVDELNNKYNNLDVRVKKTEEINYELISTQLNDIQKSNTQLQEKMQKTNERIDKVLEILLDKD